MANDNTIISLGYINLPATAAASTTNAQAFLNPAGNPVSLSIPGSYNFNGRPFRIRLIGTVANLNATSVVMTPIIALGTAATYASNAAFCSTSAGISTNLASQLSANFLTEVECLWDSVSSSINATYVVQIGPAATTTGLIAATKCTSVTSVTLGNAGSTGLNFVPFFLFSASSTNNVATITEFSIEQI